MKFFQITTCLLLTVVVVALAKKTDDEEWLTYKQKYGKKHKTAEEDEKRKNNFLLTQRMIEEHSIKTDRHFQMVHNHMSDWDQEEKAKLLGAKQEYAVAHAFLRAGFPVKHMTDASLMRELPLSLDYRTHPCMSAIKDQKNCGSCWTFASMAPLEFATCNKSTSKQPVSLSEQQLVDCVPNGCNGGWYTTAWSYLKANGVMSTEDYPYKAIMATSCPTPTTSVTTPLSWGAIANTTTDIMSALVNYGPLAAALDVQNDFMNYGSGIYSSTTCSQTRINHAVVIVGYGSSEDGDYWIVRNSWGTWWGSQGYFLIERGVNMCGVENHATFVTV